MNDRKFIELLNLYVDHEIDPEEAARLEDEVMRNPMRRKIYSQYCRMQKACIVLARTTDVFAPKPERVAARLFPARSWAGRLYVGGLVAAAACVVAVLAVRQSQTVPPTAKVRSALGVPLALAQPAPALQPVLHLTPVFSDRSDALFVKTEQSPYLNWIAQVRVGPVQRPPVADLVFAAKPIDLRPVTQPMQASQSTSESVEMTAFQFQK